MHRCRLNVMGASGSGTTTLGRALASYWSVPHADADDYFWVPTNPPHVEKRPEAERTALMRQLFVPREAWVLSGAPLGWGEDVVALCDAIVFLTLRPDERMRRLHAREEVRQEGQELDPAAWEEFITWARGYDDPSFNGRSLVMHQQWLGTVGTPVLTLDSAAPVTQLRDAVLAWDPRD